MIRCLVRAVVPMTVAQSTTPLSQSNILEGLVAEIEGGKRRHYPWKMASTFVNLFILPETTFQDGRPL